MASSFTPSTSDSNRLTSTKTSSRLPTPPPPYISHSHHLPSLPPPQSSTVSQVRRPHLPSNTTLFTHCTSPRSSACTPLQAEPGPPQRLIDMSLSNPALKRTGSPTVSTRKSSLDSDSNSNVPSTKADIGKGVLETYSLFPTAPTAPTASPPRSSPSTVNPNLTQKHEPEQKSAQSKHNKGNQNEDFSGSPSKPAKTGHDKSNQNKYSSQPPSAPPTRPLPLLPLNIPPKSTKPKPRDLKIKSNEDTDALCPMPEPLTAIHPALRRSLSSPTSDTGSIPIFLQLSKSEHETENALQPYETISPPTDLKPVSQLTSLLTTRQELEEKLRRLEAILGRYGVSEGSRYSFLQDEEGEITPPPPYQSPSTGTSMSISRSATTPPLFASKTDPTRVSSARGNISPASGSINSPDGKPTMDAPNSPEEKKKGRKRDLMRSWPSHSKEQACNEHQSPNSSRGSEKHKEKENGKESGKEKEREKEKEKKKDEDNNQSSYATRPTYGKNLEKIFGAKPFEVANAIHLSISRPSSRSGTFPSPSQSHTHTSSIGVGVGTGSSIGNSLGIGTWSGKPLFRRSADPLSPSTTAQLFTPLPMPMPVPEKRGSVRRKGESMDWKGGAVEVDTHFLDGAAKVDTPAPTPATTVRYITTSQRRDNDAAKHSPDASASEPSSVSTTTATRYLTRTRTSASTTDQTTKTQTPKQLNSASTPNQNTQTTSIRFVCQTSAPTRDPTTATQRPSQIQTSAITPAQSSTPKQGSKPRKSPPPPTTSLPPAPPVDSESPSYTSTIMTLRSEYQEAALHLAEVDLEIELSYLRGDIERVRRRRTMREMEGE